jgi:hypothetical protein
MPLGALQAEASLSKEAHTVFVALSTKTGARGSAISATMGRSVLCSKRALADPAGDSDSRHG